MKANELMTNDWVLYGGKPTRVLQLEEGKDYKNAINPIPLTVEILKKNGFYAYGNYPNRYFYNKDEGYCVEMSDCVCSKGDFSFCVMSHSELEPYNAAFVADCKYVHLLQHALRLVGLSDIAENLKI